MRIAILWNVCLDYTMALDCLACTGIQNISACNHVQTCSQNEICYTDVVGSGSPAVFNTGCRPSSSCYKTSGSTDLVGRALSRSGSTDLVGRVVSSVKSCEQCCAVDQCNGQLCSHSLEGVQHNGPCKDVSGYNCGLISSTFNICGDVQHAKLVCRNYCGLCGLVDGEWGVWGEWSYCERSCGNTQKLRLRPCDNPKPAGGGRNCIGDRAEYQNCTYKPCPIAGGWTSWLAWTACSQTCGVGLQRRDRTCSNPPPAYGGDHCFGDSLEDGLCYNSACQDGGWSVWSGWNSCSSTCNSGMTSRQRSCNNPTPSLLGKNCLGNNEQYAACNIATCPGSSSTKIYFSVNTPTGNLFSDNRPVFSHVVINEGNDYDQSSGKFTVSVQGVYQFFVTFVTAKARTQCFIRNNRNVLVYALTTASSDWKSASASTYVHCNVGDVIDLSCGGWQYVDHNATSMFSGALVSAD